MSVFGTPTQREHPRPFHRESVANRHQGAAAPRQEIPSGRNEPAGLGSTEVVDYGLGPNMMLFSVRRGGADGENTTLALPILQCARKCEEVRREETARFSLTCSVSETHFYFETRFKSSEFISFYV